MIEVTCPFCFESFGVMPPGFDELPAEWDYDCEICCRPMIISFEDDGAGDVSAFARSLAE